MSRRLSRLDVETVVLATVLLPLATLGIHIAGVQACQRALRLGLHRRVRPLPRQTAVARARRLAAMVDLANERTSLLLADCLPRALVLWWVCRRAGLDAKLLCGARTLTGRFEAHAWVEVQGCPVGEEEAVDAVYAPFELTGEKGAS